MKRLMTLLTAMVLMSATLWADETITVSANSTDISQALDLKVVANLFAEAQNLEEFETKLNDPNEFYNNLDLNGDGDVDYIRVVEVGEGNKRMIILQAILAKDIYQDIATIYVEKDASEQVSVQIIGDEYVYGTNYIIEPVYIYRPVIYDWFWGPGWYAWYSPWYWGYYPHWWHHHHCLAWDVYWHHCYAYHHHHHHCSFRYGREPRNGYREMRGRHADMSRREYAQRHPDRSFSHRNNGAHNARSLQPGQSHRQGETRQGQGPATSQRAPMQGDRTFGSRTTASSRSQQFAPQRTGQQTSSQRSGQTATTQRSGQQTQRSGQQTSQRSAQTTQRSTQVGQGPRRQTTTTTRTSSTTGYTRPSGSSSRSSSSTSSTYTGSTRSSSSSSSTTRSSSSSSSTRSTYSGGSSRSSGGYSGGSSRSSGGYSGGSGRSSSGGSHSGGGGGGSHRR
ncbi:MAG: hypothetical protein IK073_01180 [Paludibacteraceae bacterium]|nr:hypothetical protein [Paludibacteraceae bacterium]